MKLDIVYVTKLDHLYSLNISIENLLTYESVGNIYIITNSDNRRFFKGYGSRVKCLDEDTILPNMKFSDIKKMKLSYFPKIAGWYYQQLLKLGASNLSFLSENYVVVDADTIFLSEPQFFDEIGRFVFSKADEYHKPYFDTYENLLKESPNREFSFIAQYMIFNKKFVKEMFSLIEENFQNQNSWNWLIMYGLSGDCPQLFSEYETYGHFMKNHHQEKVVFIDIPWLRDGVDELSDMFPTKSKVNSLKNKYKYVSFELRPKSYFGKIKKKIYCRTYPYYKALSSYFKNI
jgi:hypothetical protein